MSNQNSVLNLIRVEDKSNPALYRALQLMIADVYTVYDTLFPPSSGQSAEQTSSVSSLGEVTNLTATAFPTFLRLNWDDINGAFRYEVRLGANWDTATPLLRTAANVVNLDPQELNLTIGDHTFLVRPVDISGLYGDLISTVVFTVPNIATPELNLDIIGNSVLLRWTVPTSTWKVDYYIIYKNSVEDGRLSGTFKLLQELSGGTYDYSIVAVDIVGNLSAVSAVRTANLTDPSDFEFVDSLFADFTGTYSNTNDIEYNSVLGVIGPVVVETWEDHFINNSWANIQAQITAGYPKYYQPSLNGSGYYEEIFDFGSLLENLTISVDYTKVQLVGTTNIAVQISVSEDDITYTSPVVASSVFGVSFRYVKVRWTFTNSDDLAAAFLSDLQVILNVSLSMDSGEASAEAADTGGTLVSYTKTFTQVNSVTATPSVSDQPLFIVIDEITETDFRVYVFNSSGTRVDAEIAWKARGVQI